ncbi:DUF262 domain-containing protein [Candidatus Kuenenia stuttgartiensis]|nr:DUF262 domain-containing protein [Candidatus Kuenenia stuttgartiensis]
MENRTDQESWYDDESTYEEWEYPLHEYELTASPNDFNVITLFNFIESGTVKIPGFQRNYVWDLKRASKLIESMIIGLPVPQIFLYEESRNRFLVIDGQQRLMSIYYFIKQRFPKKEKRTELRRIFDEHGKIPDEILENDHYFTKFNLNLPEQLPNQRNKFSRLNYSTLSEYRSAFDLRPIRSVIVKQVSPKDDNSAIYEIFNRLNSGGINLMPQEIRMSLYHSIFYDMLYRVNIKKEWRRLTGITEPDLHMKDIEFLLRGFAMLINGDKYNPSMVKFLNAFSLHARDYENEGVKYFESLFESFLESCINLSNDAFQSTVKRFSITLFESIFATTCKEAYANKKMVVGKIDPGSVSQMKTDSKFLAAAEKTTTSKSNLLTRLKRASEIIKIIE